MASMEEKIQLKRQRTETLVASLPGQSKKVRVVTFTQAQLPKAHVTETGGLLGMVLFNDGQATFQQDNTSFVRALLTPKRILSRKRDFATSRRDARQLLVGQDFVA